MTRTLGRIDVENVSSTNFEMWKLKMEDLLIDRDLWDAVDENKFRPTEKLKVSSNCVLQIRL